MRIQHNIMAMNAYRNYTNNTSALSKNLEKLSSGYKINRAGDDAAGLAISEKMRAQITGLETAQKNAKDGISLVQTAEGALQEVHDMLNRMEELAVQSANGTYDSTVDRANLQKEVDQLKSEIDRIADSANFNGIKLLDGSMSASTVSHPFEVNASNVEGVIGGKGIGITESKQNVSEATYTAPTGDAASLSGTGKVTVSYLDANGDTKTVTVSLANFSSAGSVTAADIAGALNSDNTLSGLFNITANGNKIEFETKEGGAVSTSGSPGQANITGISVSMASDDGEDKLIPGASFTINNTTAGVNSAITGLTGFKEGDYYDTCLLGTR